jgi:formate dehydrogenase alpha subunit
MRSEPLPRADARLLRIEVDNRSISVPEKSTVLQAAELAGAYVPSLCSHRELSPFGGCRLCMVEIAEMRGYPLACSTLAQDGMQVTTDTATLREMRREILQLILSQHPSSCLICDEKEACRRSQTTIRKAGVSTGCRSCPNDGDCELQRVVERVGVTDIGYPVAYRGLEAEHDDPFFDRDYNLCILCGRCVRMCHEVRGTSVLSFKYRGRSTLIGPAFANSHVEAGCEFCGACVSVCPTGALTDKVSKWDGTPDGVETSTCPLCCLGCRVELAHKDGRLCSARGAHDAEINDGQLCVSGRFCLPETTHHHSRARKPMLRRGAYFRVSSWDEALGETAEKLAAVAPDELLMLVSSDLSNEGLFAAQRLVRSGLGSNGIDSTADACLPCGPARWSRLFALPISIEALGAAEAVIVAGLDSRFSFSVAGVQVRRAVRRGARLVAVDARASNLARAADHWLRSAPGEEARALAWLVRSLLGADEPAEARRSRVGERALAAATRHVHDAPTLAVVIGPRVFDCPGAAELVTDLEVLAGRQGTTVLPLAHGANVRGALELGALSEVLPGPRPAGGRGLTLADVWAGRRPKVLYLVGEAPFTARPDCEFVIAQDLYLPPFAVDGFLPAASFVEAEGTLTSIEGRVQALRRIEELPDGAEYGYARPDWQIFSDLAGLLGHADLEYADAAAVRAAIRAEVPGFPAESDRAPRRMTPIAASPRTAAGAHARTARDAPTEDDGPGGHGRFVLVPEHAFFRHRGIDLAGVVEGLGELHLEEGLRMSPEDVARLGVERGGAVTVSVDGLDLVLAARPDPDCPRGAVYISITEAWGGLAGREGQAALESLARLPARPVRVRVRAGDRTRARAPKGDHVPGR